MENVELIMNSQQVDAITDALRKLTNPTEDQKELLAMFNDIDYSMVNDFTS